MRSLVEQVREEIVKWFGNLGWVSARSLEADSYRPSWSDDQVPVFRLMGEKKRPNGRATAAQRFLLALALWKIHRFLTNGPAFDARTGDTMGALRLRADCSLALGRVSWAGSKQGAPFGENEPLDPGRLVNLAATTEPVGLLAAPPRFESLLKPFGLGLDTTVTYGK